MIIYAHVQRSGRTTHCKGLTINTRLSYDMIQSITILNMARQIQSKNISRFEFIANTMYLNLRRWRNITSALYDMPVCVIETHIVSPPLTPPPRTYRVCLCACYDFIIMRMDLADVPQDPSQFMISTMAARPTDAGPPKSYVPCSVTWCCLLFRFFNIRHDFS